MRNRISWLQFSGDIARPKIIQVLWLILNGVRNLINGVLVWPVQTKRIVFREPRGLVAKAVRGSPSRVLCDNFLEQIPWTKIVEDIGSLDMIDFGCGNGDYQRVFKDELAKHRFSYLGVDVEQYAEWDEIGRSGDQSKFVQIESDSSLASYLSNVNFVFTHSVLEHIRNDVNILAQIRAAIPLGEKGFIQLHFVPAAPSLWLYGLHGYRQYGIRDLKRMGEMFSDDSVYEIFGVGGGVFNSLHWRYLSKQAKWMRRGGQLGSDRTYAEELEGLLKDMKNKPPRGTPSFYALLILSNFSNPRRVLRELNAACVVGP